MKEADCTVCGKPVQQKSGRGRPKQVHGRCKGKPASKVKKKSSNKLKRKTVKATPRKKVVEDEAELKIGNKFNFRGTQFTITEIIPSRPKYPIVAQNLRGTRYRFSLEQATGKAPLPKLRHTRFTSRHDDKHDRSDFEYPDDDDDEDDYKPRQRRSKKAALPSSAVCDVCGNDCVMKRSRWGTQFWGCVDWPKCWGKCAAGPSARPKTKKTAVQNKVKILPLAPDFETHSRPCQFQGARRGCGYPSYFQLSYKKISTDVCKHHYGQVYAKMQEYAHKSLLKNPRPEKSRPLNVGDVVWMPDGKSGTIESIDS